MTATRHKEETVPPESAIVIPVPEAEPIVAAWRSLYDPVAHRGVPAHITLLYPFAPPARVGSQTEALRQLFGRISPFEFSLTEIRRFPATAYLHPEPAERFSQLTHSLVGQWPEFPPYGGAFSTVIPHLTIADRTDTEVLDLVQVDIEPRLPIPCRAAEAWLLCSDESGNWSRCEIFSLRR